MKGHLNIFTARKRSFGQGNVFILVCHSVHRGGGLCPRMHHRSHDSGISVQGGSLSRGSLYRGSLYRGSLSRRISVQSRGALSRGGLCPGVSVQGVSVREIPQTETPLYGHEWAVCILLECILVKKSFSQTFHNIRMPVLPTFFGLSHSKSSGPMKF